MSAAKHTPGALVAHPVGTINARSASITDANGRVIAALRFYPNTSAERDRANADAERIVQCVNAHDALVEALRKTHAFLSVSSFHDDEDALALLIVVDAAIAKATGGQP